MLFRRLFVSRLTQRSLLVLLIAALLLGGFQLRRWTWQKTKHVRYQHDIVNGFYWGSETLTESRKFSADATSAESWSAFFHGYFALYDRVREEAYDNDYQLDYPPLRLLVMSIWAKQVRKDFPGVDDGHPKHVDPLLHANLFCELLSAVAIFFLVRFWVHRASAKAHEKSADRRAWMCGLAAASVAWLEPSMILDAHGWPQWDVWILPFYLFAALAASTKRWFWCGCLLALGAMLKGQLLLVTPFFVFWPLWQKSWASAVRLLSGFAAMFAFAVSPWLLRTPIAWGVVILIGAATATVVYRLGWKDRDTWIVGITALTAFFAGAFGGGSFAWLQIGFLYGSEHYPFLFISSCYNLPSLLSQIGWSLKESLWSHQFGSHYIAITPQWLLRFCYLGLVACCAAGAARHAQNRDPRALLAIAAPWLMMFALLGQMHERYLMWGAVMSAVAFGVSVRLSLLHFIISILSTAMIVHVMLIDRKLDATIRAIDLLNALRPWASGVALICVATWFWNAASIPIVISQWRRQLWIPKAINRGEGSAEFLPLQPFRQGKAASVLRREDANCGPLTGSHVFTPASISRLNHEIVLGDGD